MGRRGRGAVQLDPASSGPGRGGRDGALAPRYNATTSLCHLLQKLLPLQAQSRLLDLQV